MEESVQTIMDVQGRGSDLQVREQSFRKGQSNSRVMCALHSRWDTEWGLGCEDAAPRQQVGKEESGGCPRQR